MTERHDQQIEEYDDSFSFNASEKKREINPNRDFCNFEDRVYERFLRHKNVCKD